MSLILNECENELLTERHIFEKKLEHSNNSTDSAFILRTLRILDELIILCKQEKETEANNFWM